MIKKHLTILMLLAFMAASCTSSSQQDTKDKQPAEAEVTKAADSDTLAQVDGTSGATNVANPPSFNGTIITPPQNHVSITLSMGGAVRNIYALPGKYVRKGQTILTLANPEFIELQQSYLDAAAQTEYLEKEYNRQKSLAQNESSSQKRMQQSKAEYLSMKSKKASAAAKLALLGIKASSLSTTGIQPLLRIKSPQNGYVTNMDANIGKYFAQGESVCDVINKSKPMLQLTAYEKDLNRLTPNCRFAFRVNGFADKSFTARLISIDQTVDNTNRSIKVYAQIDDADPSFRPGMYVSARIMDSKPQYKK